MERAYNLKSIWSKVLCVFVALLLAAYAVVILYPLFWMVMSSMKSYNEIYRNVWSLPSEWLVENYLTAWNVGISDYFVNSFVVTGATIFLVLFIGSLAAYGLSQYKTRAIDVLLLITMGGMMISPQVTLIPLYVLLNKIGVHNTRWALILPYVSFRLPLAILLMRSYFLGVPKELEESARIDGCSPFGVYWRIFVPIGRPIMVTTAMLTAYYAWNEFLFAIIFIDSNKFKTIPSGLMNFRDALRTDWGVLLAGMVIASIPMIILLISLQKYLLRGMSEGAVKG